jgi:hypothetical protein
LIWLFAALIDRSKKPALLAAARRSNIRNERPQDGDAAQHPKALPMSLSMALAKRVAISVAIVLFGQVANPYASASIEEVLVTETKTHDDRAVIMRQNGELYLVEKGSGCVSLWRYEGRPVLIVSPGQFLALGSRLLLPDPRQQCSIWMITRGRTSFGSPWIATELLGD